MILKTLLFKTIDLALKKSSLYSALFAGTRMMNIPNRFRLVPVFWKYDDAFRKENREVEDSPFTTNMTEAVNVMQFDRPFWKASWKGFDPKDFWEVARGWQWLRAVVLPKTETERKAAVENALSWLEENSYPNGLAWAVALDVAVRAINLTIMYSLSGCSDLETHLFKHYLYLKKMLWLSKNAIRNNHYLGELITLAILSKIMNKKDTHKLIRRAEDEIERQFYPDGVSIEQSVRYHKFSLEFAILAKLFLGIDSSVIEKAGDFLMATKKPDGSWPSIGDDDLGCVIRLHDEPLNGDFRAVLSTLALLYSRGDFKSAAGQLQPETELLVEDSQRRWGNLPALTPKDSYLFDKGGFFVYRTGWKQDDSYFMIKFGPHKWHAHADLFHIELCIDGQSVLEDSGTYRYNNVPEQRRYFRGTPAHNTLTVNGLDQSRQLATFRWLKSARVFFWDIDEGEKSISFIGKHDGFKRLGLVHKRKASASKDLRSIEVTDSLEGKGTGRISLHWHFNPAIDPVIAGDNRVEIRKGSRCIGGIEFESEESLETEVIETPFSRCYGELSTKKSIETSCLKSTKKTLTIVSRFKFD